MKDGDSKVKLALLHLLKKAEVGRRSSWHRQDYCLRQFAIRSRCSPVGRDEHVSRLARQTSAQVVRQYRVK